MTVTVTPTVEGGNNPPRVRLAIAASAGEQFATVTRLDPDGRIVVVRTEDGGPIPISGGIGLLYDYEDRFGLPVTYSTLESPDTVTNPVTVDSDRVWLVHVGVPALSMPIELAAGSFDEETWEAPQGVYWPMGGEFPIVHSDGRQKAPSGSFTVTTSSLIEMRALRTLLTDATPLFLNVPPSLGLGIDTSYVAIAARSLKRPSDIGSDPLRQVQLPYQVVERPVGGSQAERSYLDLLVFSSYRDLQAQYRTYLDLLAGG